MTPLYLIKLGGSVITDKAKLCKFRENVTLRLAKELKEGGQKHIIVHGAGSFGHPKAKRYKLNSVTSQKISKFSSAIAEVQHDIRALNLKVIKCLNSAGLNPLSVPPSSIIKCKNRKIEHFNNTIFRAYTKAGFTPVTFGDVVLDEKLGFCICSGDLLMLELAKRIKFKKAIFVMDVDGFYSRVPESAESKLLFKLTPELFKEVTRQKLGSKVIDVTGSALEKMRISLELARYTQTVVINGLVRNRLKLAIDGKPVIGTEVKCKL